MLRELRLVLMQRMVGTSTIVAQMAIYILKVKQVELKLKLLDSREQINMSALVLLRHIEDYTLLVELLRGYR